jgi:regulator of protease activity HflC (stomatin/prohibitin superfamily)
LEVRLIILSLRNQEQLGKIMDKPTKVIINCETGEQEVIELTAEEIAELEAAAAQAELDRIAAEEEANAKATAKADLLEKLGITEEEAKLLLS